jgi:hypothetical protein
LRSSLTDSAWVLKLARYDFGIIDFTHQTAPGALNPATQAAYRPSFTYRHANRLKTAVSV